MTPRTSLSLLLTAVVVVLGVLGMHALSGGPHSSGGVEHGSAPSVSEPAAQVPGGQMTVHGLLDGAVASAATVSTGTDLPVDPSDAMVAMCLAALLALAVVLGVSAHRRPRGPQTHWPPRVTVLHLRQLTRAPPPDLLTRLCVLRT